MYHYIRVTGYGRMWGNTYTVRPCKCNNSEDKRSKVHAVLLLLLTVVSHRYHLQPLYWSTKYQPPQPLYRSNPHWSGRRYIIKHTHSLYRSNPHQKHLPQYHLLSLIRDHPDLQNRRSDVTLAFFVASNSAI